MITEFYTSTRDVLLTANGVTKVHIWNNPTADMIQTNPIVFIEFQPLAYETNPDNAQESNEPRIIVHILYKTLDTEDTALFDITQEVFKVMQKAGFQRINEHPDYSRGQVIDWQITFEAPRIVDETACTTYITTARPPVEISQK